MVKRYDITPDCTGGMTRVECSDGPFVLYSDYVAACDEAQTELAQIQNYLDEQHGITAPTALRAVRECEEYWTDFCDIIEHERDKVHAELGHLRDTVLRWAAEFEARHGGYSEVGLEIEVLRTALAGEED